MKLAIVLRGNQNSGKTSTFRAIGKIYGDVNPKQMKAGFRELRLFPDFPPLTLSVYFIPASPSETEKPLSKRLDGFLPSVLFIAEQKGGTNEEDTKAFLETNEYHVIIIELSDTEGPGILDRFDSENEEQKLKDRADYIMGKVQEWIKLNFFNRVATNEL